MHIVYIQCICNIIHKYNLDVLWVYINKESSRHYTLLVANGLHSSLWKKITKLNLNLIFVTVSLKSRGRRQSTLRKRTPSSTIDSFKEYYCTWYSMSIVTMGCVNKKE